jgi:hypothetical protein
MELIDAKINRREFLSFSTAFLLFGNLGISEHKMQEKVQKFKGLSLKNLEDIKKITSLKNNNFSLQYNLFENDSNYSFGTASINFNREKMVFDFGFDRISLFGSLSWFGSIFTYGDYDRLSDMTKVRFITDFDKKFNWTDYKENFQIGNSPPDSLKPHNYELKEGKILRDGTEIIYNKKTKTIQNPLSAAFEIINGNLIDSFWTVDAERTTNVNVNYKVIDDLVILEADFPVSALAQFSKVYGVLYNNVPLAGYLRMVQKEKDEDVRYTRGELSAFKIDGRDILG